MDLLSELRDGLSWRRFLVLLGNISPQSAIANYTVAQSGDEPLEGEEAEAFLESW